MASDIDEESLNWSKKNLEGNALQEKIILRHVKSPQNIFDGVIEENEQFDFSMCNPPFFSDISEANRNPKTIESGTMNELVTEGGEVEFVCRMIEQSVKCQKRVKWFTSLVGKKASLKILMAKLSGLKVTNVRTTVLHQGGQTARWVLAWSFGEDRIELSESKLYAVQQKKRRQEMERREIDFEVKNVETAGEIVDCVKAFFERFSVDFHLDTQTLLFNAKLYEVKEALETQILLDFQLQIWSKTRKDFVVKSKLLSGDNEFFCQLIQMIKEEIQK